MKADEINNLGILSNLAIFDLEKKESNGARQFEIIIQEGGKIKIVANKFSPMPREPEKVAEVIAKIKKSAADWLQQGKMVTVVVGGMTVYVNGYGEHLKGGVPIDDSKAMAEFGRHVIEDVIGALNFGTGVMSAIAFDRPEELMRYDFPEDK
jgi:hypothetical protein